MNDQLKKEARKECTNCGYSDGKHHSDCKWREYKKVNDYFSLKNSENEVERTVYWIMQLSPHNAWNAVVALEEMIDKATLLERKRWEDSNMCYCGHTKNFHYEFGCKEWGDGEGCLCKQFVSKQKGEEI